MSEQPEQIYQVLEAEDAAIVALIRPLPAVIVPSAEFVSQLRLRLLNAADAEMEAA